jgi:hypothetical protein
VQLPEEEFGPHMAQVLFFRWEVSWGCMKILGKQPNPVVKDDFPKCYDNLGYIGIPWHTLFLDTT